MSTLSVSNITDGTTTVGTSYVVNGSAKAWLNFNGTGTIAIRDSVNVASLTDQGTARYSINLSSSMSNASYSINALSGGTDNDANTSLEATSNHTITASEYRLVLRQSSGNTLEDMSHVFSSIHGDLA